MPMKYLFFDIECANCNDRRGKIYSFGYIIADEGLNVIESEKDIVMNPDVDKWDWYVLKNILAYSKRDVESKSKFNKQYNKIKRLLEDEEIIVCGFSVKDDVGYILDECERYKLEPIKIKFFDVQRLEAKISKKETKGLSEAYIAWCKQLPLGAHRSDVDARFTLDLAKEICKKQKKTLQEFILEDELLSGKTDGFKYGFNDEQLETRDERFERKEAERILRFAGRKDKSGFRELKEECKDYILKGSKNNLLFLRLMENVKPKSDREQTLLGKKISISLNYEAYNFTNMMKIVQLICDCGGEYVKKASTADIFVKYHLLEDGEERRCSKYEFVQEEIQNGKDICVVEFDDFLKMIGITEKGLNELPIEDYEYLMDKKYKREKLA